MQLYFRIPNSRFAHRYSPEGVGYLDYIQQTKTDLACTSMWSCVLVRTICLSSKRRRLPALEFNARIRKPTFISSPRMVSGDICARACAPRIHSLFLKVRRQNVFARLTALLLVNLMLLLKARREWQSAMLPDFVLLCVAVHTPRHDGGFR